MSNKIQEIWVNDVFDKIEKYVKEFQDLNPDLNLLDNYNHRTYRIQLKTSLLWDDIVIDKGRTKSDAHCDSMNLKNIEIKTRNNKDKKIDNKKLLKTGFMFDKQDRPGRREYILKVDGLIFSIFHCEKLYWIFWTCDKGTISEYKNICVKKQNEFLPKFKEKQSELIGNGGYDNINISINEFSNDSIWNLYYENNIYEDKSLKEIKEILNIK